jgi:MFS family permease
VFCILGWTFTSPDKHMITTPLLVVLHMLMGLAMAGVTLASGNMALKLAPRRQATSFLAVKSILISLSAGVAPLVGGLFADFFEDKTLSIDLHWQSMNGSLMVPTISLQHWDFFFLLSFVIGLYSLRYLMRVEEDGAVKHRVAMREMMQDTTRAIRGISTIAGMRDACMYPMKIMVNRKNNKD